MAIVQPALDVLSENAELFVWQRATPAQLVGLTLLFLLVPAVSLWLVEVLVGLVLPPARRFAHAGLAGVLVALFVMQLLDHELELVAPLAIVSAVALGIAGGVVVARFAVARTWLHYLALAPVTFAGLFVFASPVTEVVLGGEPTAATVEIGSPERVVMIVLDELPTMSLLDASGNVDAALFPNFAALSRDSTWYRNHTTVAPLTEAAVPAIVSGTLPVDGEALPIASEYPHSLFTLLGRSYEMNVVERSTKLCPSSICTSPRSTADAQTSGVELVSASTRLWYEFVTPGGADTSASYDVPAHAERFDTARSFVRSLTPASGPRLDFLHILLPHQPWHFAASGQDYLAKRIPGLGSSATWLDVGASLSARQRHLLQLQFTDRLLGQVVDKLRSSGDYDRSLLVVTADHGAAFTAGTMLRGVDRENYPEIAWTPLWIKAPHQGAGAIDDRVALGIDVLPTIAEHLDIDLPWRLDGRSLLGEPRTTTDRPMLDWGDPLEPPPGREYVTLDGVEGFARMIGGTVSSAEGDPRLRLFRLVGSAYGGLVGREASSYVDPSAPPLEGRVTNPESFAQVRSSGRVAPWLYLRGRVERPPGLDRWVAVSLNGTIAAVAVGIPDFARPELSSIWSALPAHLFRPGRNDVELYAISGNASWPTLTPIGARR